MPRPLAKPPEPGEPGDALPRSLDGSGRFVVLGPLGRGGMGVVYEALDRELGQRVALKMLPEVDPEAVLRFKNEFRALQDLAHPNLVELGELFEDEGRWFFTMELVQGTDFITYVRGSAAGAQPSTRTHVLDSSDTAVATTLFEATRAPPPDGPTRADVRSHGRAVEPATAATPAGRTVEPSAGAVPTASDVAALVDDERLRGALAQLARGLSALHRAEKVHRDIKPSNVLVTPSGHVKILDFGLISDALHRFGWQPGTLIGTPAFMAPEQAASPTVGPEADWYSVGVMLYQALVGRPPFVGTPEAVLRLKNDRDPPAPSVLAPGVSADLDALCMALLVRDPAQRAAGRTILERLRVGRGAGEAPPERAPFLGREEELAVLRRAFEASAREQVTVVLHGESGVGKSALVAHFVATLREASPADAAPEIVVLPGRCHERESVPFKAVDGIVDALSEVLLRASEEEVDQLLPEDAGYLAQVFPVLRRVPALAALPLPTAPTPEQARARLFGAFGGLIRRLCTRRRVAVVIDDLQWTDADSLALLRDVLRPGQAPPLLLVATLRQASLVSSTEITQADVRLPGDVRHQHLGGLPPAEAEQLAETLLHGLGRVDAASALAIAREAAGHPMFIDELVRHARGDSPVPASGARLRLDEAIGVRLRVLGPTTRGLLELIAVAAGPLALETLALTTELDRADLRSRLGKLRAARLVRTGGQRSIDMVEPYHDRVRSAALAALDPDARRVLHGRLALAFERSADPEPEALARHWREAGRPDRAAPYAVSAAEKAAALFAFNRAAEMYRLAASLTPDAGEAAALRIKRAEVLTYAGRGPEAAGVYLEAVAEAGLDAETALELRRRAALQLLASGVFDRGLDVMRDVLAAVDMAMPSSPVAVVTSVLLRRLQVRWRGLGFAPRAEHDLPPELLRRIDVCWAAVAGLGLIDPVRGADFQARHLVLALDAGEPYRVCRALGGEAMHRAAEGTPAARTTGEVLDRLAHAVDTLGRPAALEALLASVRGAVAHLQGRYREVPPLMVEAEALYGRQFTDTTHFELDSVRVVRCGALTWLGRYGAFLGEVDGLVEESLRRGHRYVPTYLRTGIHTQTWLARGDVYGARQRAEEAIRSWPSDRVDVPHLIDVLARCTLALWDGRWEDAEASMEAGWARVSAAHLLRCQYLRINTSETRARVLLARAAARPDQRRRLLGAADREVTRLSEEPVGWARALGALANAGVAALRDAPAEAVAALRAAVQGFDGEAMGLHAAVARARLGTLIGGDEGRALTDDAAAYFAREGITARDEMIRLLAPGV